MSHKSCNKDKSVNPWSKKAYKNDNWGNFGNWNNCCAPCAPCAPCKIPKINCNICPPCPIIKFPKFNCNICPPQIIPPVISCGFYQPKREKLACKFPKSQSKKIKHEPCENDLCKVPRKDVY